MSAPVVCSTGKRRFTSADGAARRLAAILDAPEPGRLYVPSGYRRCEKCSGFHLTSKSGKPTARGKSRRGSYTKGRTR